MASGWQQGGGGAPPPQGYVPHLSYAPSPNPNQGQQWAPPHQQTAQAPAQQWAPAPPPRPQYQQQQASNSGYNPTAYGPMPGGQAPGSGQPPPAPPPRVSPSMQPAQYQQQAYGNQQPGVQQPVGSAQQYAAPSKRTSIAQAPLPAQAPSQPSGIQGYQQEVQQNPQGWPQHPPYSTHPPTHGYEPQHGGRPGSIPQQTYYSAADIPHAQPHQGTYFPPPAHSAGGALGSYSTTSSPPVPSGSVPLNPQTGVLSPNENQPAYVPPSLSGQGVASYIPANTNPAPGVYVPPPPADVPAWSMAQQPPVSGQTKKFRYTRPAPAGPPNVAGSTQVGGTPYQQGSSYPHMQSLAHTGSMQSPSHPMANQHDPSAHRYSTQPGWNQYPPSSAPSSGADVQYQSSPPIPATYSQSPQPSGQQDWQPQTQHANAPFQGYTQSPQQSRHSSYVGAPPQSQSSQSSAFRPTPSHSQPGVSPPSAPVSPVLHRQSIGAANKPSLEQPSMEPPRRTGSNMSIGRKPVRQVSSPVESRSSTDQSKTTSPPISTFSAIGSGGPYDWEHYGAFELPSNPSPPPPPPPADTRPQEFAVVGSPNSEVIEPSVTPEPLNIRKSPLLQHSQPPAHDSPNITPPLRPVAAELPSVHESLVGREYDEDPSHILAAEAAISRNGSGRATVEDTLDRPERREPSPLLRMSTTGTERSISPTETISHFPDEAPAQSGAVISEIESELQSAHLNSRPGLSDVVPDLDAWYVGSLERYAAMLRQEARTGDVHEKARIFQDFFSAEARARGIELSSSGRIQGVEEQSVPSGLDPSQMSTAQAPFSEQVTVPESARQPAPIQTSNVTDSPVFEEYSPGGRPIIPRPPTGNQEARGMPPNQRARHSSSPRKPPPERTNSWSRVTALKENDASASYKPYRNSIGGSGSSLPPILDSTVLAGTDSQSDSRPGSSSAAQPTYKAFKPDRSGSLPSPKEPTHRRQTSGSISGPGRREHEEIFYDARHDESFSRRKSSVQSPGLSPNSPFALPSPKSPSKTSDGSKLAELLPQLIQRPEISSTTPHPRLTQLYSRLHSFPPHSTASISQLFSTWARELASTRSRLGRERQQRLDDESAHHTRLFEEQEIDYSELERLDAEVRSQERSREAEEAREEYRDFEKQLFSPAYGLLQQAIQGLMEVYVGCEGLSHTASAGLAALGDASASTESLGAGGEAPRAQSTDTTPPLTEVLTLLATTYAFIESRHAHVAALVSARDRMYMRGELASILHSTSSASDTTTTTILPALNRAAPAPTVDDVIKPLTDANAPTQGFSLDALITAAAKDPARADKLRTLRGHFTTAAHDAGLRTARDAVERATRLRSAVDTAVARGVRTDEADIARIVAAVEGLGTIPLSPTADSEGMRAVLGRAKDAIEALGAQSEVLLRAFADADQVLNEADGRVARAEAVKKGAGLDVMTRLEGEMGREKEKLGRESEGRLEGARELVRKEVAVVERAGEGVNGEEGEVTEEVERERRLKAALEEAKRRNGESV